MTGYDVEKCDDLVAALQFENERLKRRLKFAQLERDNRTSAYEVCVKTIGELKRDNERLKQRVEELEAQLDAAKQFLATEAEAAREARETGKETQSERG